MSLNIHRVQVWGGEIPDRPGTTAALLAVLARAGVELKYIFARPHPAKADTGVLFLAPIVGPEQEQTARELGLAPDREMSMLCVEGENRSGVGYEMMSHLATAGINLRGLSISAVGDRFAAYLAFDNPDAAAQAIRVLAALA